MGKEERKQKIEELSKKMKEVNLKIKEGTDTVIVAGMEAKDVLDEKMKDAQSGLEAAKEQCRIATEKGKSKISSELLKAQMNFKVAKENMQERKEARDKEKLSKYDGIVVPGGFGDRGIEGMIETIKYAREEKVPFLGICLGMQMTVIEYARNVLGIKDANSAEFSSNTKNPVIHIMETQKEIKKKGGTMRLGSYPCVIKEGSLANEVYGTNKIDERHRHRFEYNNDYKERLENAGLTCSGVSPDGSLVEIVELKEHPYFIAGQFHPELKSRPNRPAPLFVGLIKAAKK